MKRKAAKEWVLRNFYIRLNNLDFDPRLLTKITEKNEGKQIHPKKEKKIEKNVSVKKSLI